MLQLFRHTGAAALYTLNTLELLCSTCLRPTSSLSRGPDALPHQGPSPWRQTAPRQQLHGVDISTAPKDSMLRRAYVGTRVLSWRSVHPAYPTTGGISLNKLSCAYSTDASQKEDSDVVQKLKLSLSTEQIHDFLATIVLSSEEVAQLHQLRDDKSVARHAWRLVCNRSVAAQLHLWLEEPIFKPGDKVGMGRYLLLGPALPAEDALNVYLLRKSWFVCWEAQDLVQNRPVVIQLTESPNPDVYEAATRAAAMHALAGQHPNILALLDVFEHRTHQGRHACLVFEKAGSPLAKVQLDFNGRRLWSKPSERDLQPEVQPDWSGCMLSDSNGIKALKSIAMQLFTALDHVHSHGLVHLDISLDNILLDRPFVHELWHSIRSRYSTSDQEPKGLLVKVLKQMLHTGDEQARGAYGEPDLYKATIKLTGFTKAMPFKLAAAAKGGPLEHVTSDDDRYGHIVGTSIELRTPEEILGLPYAAPAADIWKAGLLLYELAMGNTMFSRAHWWRVRVKHEKLAPFTDDDMHLMDIVDTLGNLPRALIRRSPHFNQFFMYDDTLKIGRVIDIKPAAFEISKLVHIISKNAVDAQEANAFHNFLTSVLVIDPLRRPTAADVLKHPWLQDMMSESDLQKEKRQAP